MGLSRALLGGVATGFLKGNNDRRDRMTKRMQELAADTAGQARERAKSQLSTAQKNAQEEIDKIDALRSEGAIDEKGMYKDSYWLRQSQADWKTYGEPADLSHKEYTDTVYKADRAKGITRKYMSAAEINQAHAELQSSISSNLKNDLNKPTATALDRFLGKSLRKMTGTPQEIVEESPALPTFDPRLPDGAPLGSYDGTGVIPDVDTPTALDPENHMKVYAKDAEGGVDTSSVRSVFVNKADGKLYESTSEGAVPFEGDWIDANAFDTKAPSTPKKQAALSNFRNDIDKDLEEKFNGANKTLRLTKGIVDLAGVETAAAISTIPAKISEFFGTEWAALKSEDLKQEFMKDKINSIIRLDEGANPETLTEISAALGSMESMKLALAYASVKMNRGGGRFSAQELNTQLALFKDRSLPFMLASLNTTYKEALIGVKRDVKAMAAQASVNHLYNRGVPNSYSQVKGNLTTEPRQDTNGNWVVLIDEESRETYGAKYIIVTPDGGVQYK